MEIQCGFRDSGLNFELVSLKSRGITTAFLILLDMGLIQKYISQLESASGQLEMVAIRAVKDNQDFILSTLKHDQLGEGMDSFGRMVGEYAAKTEEYYSKRKPLPRTPKITGSPYNFEWTGKFFDGMKVKTSKEGFEITSPSKDDLEKIFGTKLTALTKENLDFVNEKVVIPALYKHIFDAMAKL